MEEMIKNHDDWWDSLTEEEKQKIADEAQAATTYFNEERANNALEQYRKDYDYKECYIVEGPYNFSDEVKELAEKLDEVYGIKTYFVKLDEMIDIIREKYYGENVKPIITTRKFF